MPCYDPRSRSSDEEDREIDKLTDLLCKVGRTLLNGEDVPPDVIKWWKEHAKEDAKRGEPWVKKP